MNTPRFYIDPDIRKAETLPASFYRDQQVFDDIREQIFARSWHYIGDENLLPFSGSVHPLTLLDNYLGEPLILSRDENDKLRCLSNVCTHRGNLVVQSPGRVNQLSCMYHGRRYALDGSFKAMPEFRETENFPRPCDSLPEFPMRQWGPFLFMSLQPGFDFDEVMQVMSERVGFLPLREFKHSQSLSKDYLVNAHWALYCDNYLEGFHIPFVHADLNAVLDYHKYRSVLYPHMNLQIGYTDSGQEVFDLPPGHPDEGKHVAAYYYWIFPNMMFNFYPWGLSINIVKPIGIHKTKVSFITYIYDESKLNNGAGALLDKVEREDEFVVESVHRGLQSRYYQTGRFSASRETGTHHFQLLLANWLGDKMT